MDNGQLRFTGHTDSHDYKSIPKYAHTSREHQQLKSIAANRLENAEFVQNLEKQNVNSRLVNELETKSEEKKEKQEEAGRPVSTIAWSFNKAQQVSKQTASLAYSLLSINKPKQTEPNTPPTVSARLWMLKNHFVTFLLNI